MSKIENIYDTVGQTITVYGLPSAFGIIDGTNMIVVWINDTHVELKSTSGVRICLRTYIAEEVIHYKTTITL